MTYIHIHKGIISVPLCFVTPQYTKYYEVTVLHGTKILLFVHTVQVTFRKPTVALYEFDVERYIDFFGIIKIEKYFE